MTRLEAPDVAPGGGVTLGQLAAGGQLRRCLALFGPAFVASVAYVDPGNFATNFIAGSRFGYTLIWVVVLANLMAMPVQFLSAKVGIVTGRSLAQVCREHTGPVVRLGLWAQAELVAMFTDLAEFVGAAIGLNLLFGVPALVAGVITAVAAFAILALQAHGARPFERAIFLLLLIIFAGFGYQLFTTGVDASAMTAGLLPGFDGDSSVYLASGIIGATMMPHVIYLHSALTARRVRCSDDSDRRQLLRFERGDVIVALGAAGLINLSMLVIAAQTFHGTSGLDVSLTGIHRGLATALGGGAALAFAVALLASGISSSSVGTFAGQEVMSGFLRRQVPLALRRLVTMTPALVVLGLGLNATQALTLSQVVLSFGIPFALVPLLIVTSSRTIMGQFRNPPWLTATMSLVIALVIALNATLLCNQFG
jgi:manganese transport protein